VHLVGCITRSFRNTRPPECQKQNIYWQSTLKTWHLLSNVNSSLVKVMSVFVGNSRIKVSFVVGVFFLSGYVQVFLVFLLWSCISSLIPG